MVAPVTAGIEVMGCMIAVVEAVAVALDGREENKLAFIPCRFWEGWKG